MSDSVRKRVQIDQMLGKEVNIFTNFTTCALNILSQIEKWNTNIHTQSVTAESMLGNGKLCIMKM